MIAYKNWKTFNPINYLIDLELDVFEDENPKVSWIEWQGENIKNLDIQVDLLKFHSEKNPEFELTAFIPITINQKRILHTLKILNQLNPHLMGGKYYILRDGQIRFSHGGNFWKVNDPDNYFKNILEIVLQVPDLMYPTLKRVLATAQTEEEIKQGIVDLCAAAPTVKSLFK